MTVTVRPATRADEARVLVREDTHRVYLAAGLRQSSLAFNRPPVTASRTRAGASGRPHL